MCSNVFTCVQTCSKPVQLCSTLLNCSYVIKYVQMYSNMFKTFSNEYKSVQICLKVFKHVQTFSNLVQSLFKGVNLYKLGQTRSN